MHQRHVAIGALLRLRRGIKRTRPLAGNTTRLPIVVLVEPANPTVTVHWKIEMHLMAGGAEFGCLSSHKRLQKNASVRFRIQFDDEVVKSAHYWILARSQIMELGILQKKISLAHGAFHLDDRVAHHAAQ